MGLSLRDPPPPKTRTPPRNVIFFASPMGNQRLQRRLLGTRWSQMLVFNSTAGGGVVKKTPVHGVLCSVLKSTIVIPVGGRGRKTLKTPRCRVFVSCRNIITIEFLREAGVLGQRPKKPGEFYLYASVLSVSLGKFLIQNICIYQFFFCHLRF